MDTLTAPAAHFATPKSTATSTSAESKLDRRSIDRNLATMPKRPPSGNPRGAGRKPYKPPDELDEFLHSLTDADSIYTLQQSSNSVKSSSVKMEDSDPSLATTSGFVSGISTVKNMSQLDTSPGTGRPASMSASQPLADSDSQNSSAIQPEARAPQDIEVNLAALAKRAVRFRLEDATYRTLKARMNELRALMADEKYSEIEFRSGHTLASDDEWANGLLPYNASPKRYWQFLEVNVTKLVLLPTLERQGKLALKIQGDEVEENLGSAKGLLELFKLYQDRGGHLPAWPIYG
jgi:hypothetical protein